MNSLKQFISVRVICASLIASACLFVSLFTSTIQQAEAQSPVIELQQALTGLQSPVLVTNAHDGSNRLFIIEQAGVIRVLQPGATSATVFLNITTKISSGGERGLLGLTFHPKFTSNRRFFVNYTRTGDGATVIAEYKASATDPNVAEAPERIILTIDQPFANHNGGMIEFGPDGYLYLGMGDGGSANDPGNRAQNLENLLGKFLRIDLDQTSQSANYTSPSSNPYFGATAGRDEIYAFGVRNPWRWSFDRNNGELIAADVGQNAKEWVHKITRGTNYGWATWEGSRCNTSRPSGSLACTALANVPPLVEYDHNQDENNSTRCSITGGYVYRGGRGALPTGAYLYGDYCTGEVWLWQTGTITRLLNTTHNISSFGEDEYGELYLVALGGTIFRIARPGAQNFVSTVSAASFRVNTAPGSIAAAFGNNLATGSAFWTSGQQPVSLNGTTVKIRDAQNVERDAPLFYVSPTQVNYLIPAQTAPGTAIVTVTSGSNVVSTGAMVVRPVAPSLFTAEANGSGQPAAYLVRVQASGTQSNENLGVQLDLGAASEQVFLILFGSGISSGSAVSVSIGGESAEVNFAGASPNFVGVDQINARLPRTLIGRGNVNVVVTVDGIATTNQVAVNISAR